MPENAGETNGSDTYANALVKLSDAIERNIDRAARTAAALDRTLISLSSGALLLSTTLVSTFAPRKLLLPLLFFAWLSFVVSMVLVILAMRSQQTSIEKGIGEASDALSKLESRPDIALEFIKEFKLPLTQKKVSRSTIVGRLNKWALRAFIIGVICLTIFAGYNLWKTPPYSPKRQPEAKMDVFQNSPQTHESRFDALTDTCSRFRAGSRCPTLAEKFSLLFRRERLNDLLKARIATERVPEGQ